MNNTVNTLAFYTFGSPRYKTTVNYPTSIIPENYSYHDSVLGTYDKNFPLYNITESPIPKLELIDKENNISEIKGVFTPFLAKPKYKVKEIGKTINKISPKNSNLDYKTIYYNEYLNIKLNPAWCVLQQDRFLIRILGNTLLSEQLYSLPIELSSLPRIYESFPRGLIVKYKNLFWKCLVTTNLYPPEPDEVYEPNEFWLSINGRLNVFNADIFVMNDSKTDYFMEVSDDNRQFNPLLKDDNLISWNLAYWQE